MWYDAGKEDVKCFCMHPEQMENESQGGNWLTQVHLEEWP